MKKQAASAPAAFDEWPAGVEYAGPWPWGSAAETVAADFMRWYSRAPAAVLWVKPGMWIAGPVVTEPAALASTATNGDAAALAQARAGAELGSAPAATMESVSPKAPTEIIAAYDEPGRAATWIQPSLI